MRCRHLVLPTALLAPLAARLDLGESSSLLAELRSSLDHTPLDERLWAHLALALYRSGRQADALRVLGDARRVLGEEVGVDPGPALKALEADILDQSPSLIWVPVGISAISVTLNAMSRSPGERRMWVPVGLVLLGSSLVVALTT
jgi:DNA-binding SARP family transcriptional activator